MHWRYLGYTALALSCLLPVSAAALTLEVVPSSTSADIGDPITFDVIASGLGDMTAPSLGTFDLLLTYSPTQFSFGGLTFGPHLGAPMSVSTFTFTFAPGGIVLLEESLLSPSDLNAAQPDSFTLFTVTFIGHAPGVGVVEVKFGHFGDENAVALTLDSATPAVVTVAGGVPTDIPTLSQWGIMMLTALLMMAAARGLRRARS